ncbi:MAG: prefoldin subunit alpha [Candidatus Micrarchaeales archaeon]|jgi:prefoldin alpha subunit|uniref:Prefoldin subunit alpha n=1 Tax=Candidatus Micrarchaeum acidiphilum ARMAN-2 TaxID=425595 RepID=C7DIM6_MICA2|nr:MAG: prefoldin, alpha subunit [Candidatus Micrarchaeum acidiphilum ARMAN-2]MCW6161057.1 prefoldin subunit alpha [Candidatus Micrarchaeales archaeon]
MAENVPDKEKSESIFTLNYIRQVYQNQYLLTTKAIEASMDLLNDLNTTKVTLENMDSIKGHNILAPISNSSYLYGKVEAGDKIIINIGAGYMIEETVEEAKSFVSRMIEKESKYITELSKNKGELESAILDLNYRLEQLSNQ